MSEKNNDEKLEIEMSEYALSLIIETEGNKFKAIKLFKEKYNVDIERASKFINNAYDKINNEEQAVEEKASVTNSIEEIVKRNNFEPIYSIKEVRDIYGYGLLEAKEMVDAAIRTAKASQNYINPNGIKRTIIVSQNSRKKAVSAVGRGLIGSFIMGPAGLLAGASAKTQETTTFQVIYNNGKQETITVENGSRKFNEFCKYLDK